MHLDIAAAQAALAEDGLDAWLLYDFRGINPTAVRLSGLAGTGKMATRRWFYLIPRTGEPRALVHAIERWNLDHLPGEKIVYSHRDSLAAGLERLLGGARQVAMEYAPDGGNPYVSRVDGGTLDLVRKAGAEVVSSGDLIQRFEGIWSEAALETHREASAALYRIKDRTFAEAARRLRDGLATTELDLQQLMMQWFEEEGLIADSTPNVSAAENAGNPHYHPSPAKYRPFNKGEVLLIDLWGKLKTPGAVYADITWMAVAGREAPPEVARAFEAAMQARDAGIALVKERVAKGEAVRGWEVDRAARGVLEAAGYKDEIWHRTGHSLGEEVHGNGVHMDDYETHDERRLLVGSCFTIEPGLYTSEFGVRTEINMYVTAGGAEVTGPIQTGLVPLVD